MYFSGIIVAAVCLIVFLPSPSQSITIPDPSPHDKPFKVAHHRSSIVDSSRKDPYNASEDRKLAFSLFLPVDGATCTRQCDVRYMPDQTAKVSNLQVFGNEGANFFEKLNFNSCCAGNVIDLKNVPTIVLEPAAGVSRFVYNQLARQVSCVGVAVVTIDHPYDASIVEFEDASDKNPIKNNGTVPLSPFEVNTPWNDTMSKPFQTRLDDVEFVIGQLSSIDTLKKYFPDLTIKSPLNTNNLIVMGHGLGGAVATLMTTTDERVHLSINLAGGIPAITSDVQGSIVFFGREGFTRENDANWKESRKHFIGKFVEWTYKKSGQMDYTDLPRLVELVNDPNLKAKGLGENGPWAFHCTACFLEGYVRDTIGDRREVVECVRLCPNMVPYQP